MADRASRILIETIVRRTLRSIREEPERSTRNLVDMALQFSDGRFQQRFFAAAQTMLQNERSPYYGLIQDVAANVEENRLLTFGMDVGYNGCTHGAAVIRQIEQEEHIHIPWCVSLHPGADPLRWQPVIRQGRELGICVWMLYPEESPQDAIALARAFPDCAFVLFCKPEAVTPALADTAEETDNLMLAVRLEEITAEVCMTLRERGLLYSVWFSYTEPDAAQISGGALFCAAETAHPVFTILQAAPDCPEPVRRQAAAEARKARELQLYRTIPWEMEGDCAAVDSAISGEAGLAHFDSEGNLLAADGTPQSGLNLFHLPWKEILRRAWPKA